METLIVNIDNSENVQVFLEVIKKLDFVKSVERTSRLEGIENKLAEEPKQIYNWIVPDRPATEKEIDRLIADMEVEEANGEYYSVEEAKEKTLLKLEEWQKKQ